ncbi:hypothetical protein NMY22_g2925 [Coprinellus aureogranulatus]|nr:hypothetical protein NMY22_g2925 [Coprinellus aureogranulatus]
MVDGSQEAHSATRSDRFGALTLFLSAPNQDVHHLHNLGNTFWALAARLALAEYHQLEDGRLYSLSFTSLSRTERRSKHTLEDLEHSVSAGEVWQPPRELKLKAMIVFALASRIHPYSAQPKVLSSLHTLFMPLRRQLVHLRPETQPERPFEDYTTFYHVGYNLR